MTQPPCSIEMEQAVLGLMLIDGRVIDAAATELTAEAFFEPLHRRTFGAIMHLAGVGKVTPLLLRDAMKADPGIKDVGLDYFFTLAEAAPSSRDISHLARYLRDLAARREMVAIAQDLSESATASPLEAPSRAIADTAMEALLAVGQVGTRPVLTPYEAAALSLQESTDVALGKPVPMVKTRIEKVDREIGGLRGGDLIVVAARSGMGKSALAGTIALNTARAGIPTIVFSLEMTARQFVERMICDIDFNEAPKPMWYSRIRNGRLSADEFTRYGEAMQVLHGLPLEIIDEDDLTIQQIAARSRAFAAKHDGKIGVALIDYLQIVRPGEAMGRNREQEVAQIARGAKALAKRLGWPVVAGSQMNEGAEQRGKDERKPQAGDVRESKAIMNEADLILSPYRLAYYVENRKPTEGTASGSWAAWKAEMDACRNRMDLLALKNRHGRRFEIELFCEMGSSAIRDDAPYRPMSAAESAAQQLLEGI